MKICIRVAVSAGMKKLIIIIDITPTSLVIGFPNKKRRCSVLYITEHVITIFSRTSL